MPRRKDISSILIIGAGPIIIGQACEFDYSGAKACKALKEEGFRVILVNSNPATIMTDPLLADATYIEPIHWQSVEKIIEKEKPDAILPTMGGQTALNTALTLDKKGILEKHNVFLIGANRTAIDKAEDRQLFDETMKAINLETNSVIVEVNKKYFRPTEVASLKGDITKAKKILKWKPKISFKKLVEEMVDKDLEDQEKLLY